MALNTINIPATQRAILAGIEKDSEAGSQFKFALAHKKSLVEWDVGMPSGITMCYGDCEGLPTLVRAFEQLGTATTKFDFANRIAIELNNFAKQFPPDKHNLCYAHFLLHGLAQSTVKKVVIKLADNARIIRETQKVLAKYLECKPPQLNVADYSISLSHGMTDDYHGISLQLVSLTRGKWDNILCKVGFFIDISNERAVIINVQGQKSKRQKPIQPVNASAVELKEFQEQLKIYRELAEQGREYARFAAKVGSDPRAYVLQVLFKYLKNNGIKEAYAIRPSEHPMAIGQHAGFRANYEPVFTDAGMKELDQVYFSCKID